MSPYAMHAADEHIDTNKTIDTACNAISAAGV
jgi:hypothetical protein